MAPEAPEGTLDGIGSSLAVAGSDPSGLFHGAVADGVGGASTPDAARAPGATGIANSAGAAGFSSVFVRTAPRFRPFRPVPRNPASLRRSCNFVVKWYLPSTRLSCLLLASLGL